VCPLFDGLSIHSSSLTMSYDLVNVLWESFCLKSFLNSIL
jgi:hypothetical protein